MKSSNVNRLGRIALLAGVLATALLASCGGGSQTSTFTASRVIAFGDESSVINANGSKYTINALASSSSTAFDCTTSPLWIQSLAAIYGLTFPQCPSLVADPTSRIYATPGARVVDLSTQIDQQILNGGFVSTDMVTVLIGANDVIDQFTQYPAISEDQLLANVDAAGVELANQVNRLAGLGAKVLISTIPDMGLTPYAGDRTAGSTNGNPAILSALSARFNDAMLANITNDGHKIGLMQLDQYLIAIDKATQAGITTTYANTTLAACTVALPNCNTNTLTADAVGAVWLWADDRHLSPNGQLGLASLAITRAQNNPF